MAIQQTKTTESGITIDNAYHRVCRVSLPTKTTIEFCVCAYVSAQTQMPFASDFYTCAYAIDGDNPIRQAYLHLKTLPEFANAVDC